VEITTLNIGTLGGDRWKSFWYASCWPKASRDAREFLFRLPEVVECGLPFCPKKRAWRIESSSNGV